MDRREVEHVEAELPDRRQLRDHVVEGAVAVRVTAEGAREDLVPGRETGGEAVGDHLERHGIARQVHLLGMAPDAGGILRGEDQPELRRIAVRSGDICCVRTR